MNSDKVRIYDLSKELHLENKDVLAICSQLNIAVKSHSSTIGESEAERIRLVAKKYTARRTASPRELAATKQKAPSPMTAKAQSKPSSHDKEQILEIRKLNTQDRINPNSKGSPKVPPASVMMLTPPTRPEARPNQPEVTLVKADTDGTPAKNQQQISAKAPEVAEVAEVAEQQPLVKPPTRPVPPVPPTPVLTQPEPPVLTEPELSVLTQPEPPVLTQPKPPVLTQPKPPVLTEPKPPVLTEPEPSELKPEQVIETPNQSVETKTETTAKKSARRKKAATDQGAAKTQPALELLRPKPPRPVEPETPPVATRPQLTVVAPEPKVPQERPVEIAPTAKAPPEKPQPVKPPAKPVPPAAVTPETSQEEPPVKRDRVKKARQQPKETTTETAKREAPKAQQVVELRRPKPVRSVEAEIPAVALLPKPTLATAQPKAVDAKAPELLLDRPEPPRLAKGGKKRQEEEIDDDQESKAKAGKAGAKVKRLKPLVDDFEEDWEDTAEDDAATPISLAVVRPAKQKASVVKSPAIATLMTAAAKSKKSTNFRQQSRPEAEPQRTRPETLVVTGGLTVQELAQALAVQDTEIVKILFLKGKAVSITQSLDLPTITLVGEALEVKIETAEPEAQARKLTEMLDVEDLENLQRRPPVVTIMGHVDHGKTSLLDAIRHTKVAAGEAGGITQHIGAYHVDVEQDGNVQQVVFLDTPGHQAFTAMRARGARVTDIAILVVAADDGVQPQTVEAIGHAKAAGVPLVVAINKIDKPDAQPDRVKQELTEYGLVPEEWGGDTIMVPVSAIKGENLDTLLEMILLVAEVSDLQANPNRLAKGTVIEANLDKTRGSAATLLVQNGTLHVGDILVAGSAFGKVRAMIDDRGRRVQVASPSFAVEVLGLSEVPAAGDEFEVFQNEKEARAIATAKADKQRQSRLLQGRISLTNLSAQAQEGKLKELNLILKADVQGSVEAIVGALKQLPQNEVQLSLLLAAPGEITETDIDLAAASNAVIVGFNTTLASGARQAADAAGVDVRDYTIIYKLLEDIQDAMEGLLEPELVEQPLGTVEVRAVFPVGNGFVAGCYVQSGKVIRNSKLRVRRAGKVVYEGTIDSLKRMKEDVKEVNAGYECGIGVDKFNQWAESDIIEAYQMVTKRRTLSISK